MIFANSILLIFGGLLVGVPILLHLLMQPKPKPAVFPAIRFLRERQQSTQRRLQLRHWILLALRGLVVLLFAIALAGPAVAQADFGKWIGAIGFGAVALMAGVLFLVTALGKRGRLLGLMLLAVCLACLGTAGWNGYRAWSSNAKKITVQDADPVAALIIFENTPRMTYIRDNQSHLERGREMGDWVLGQLPPGSRIAIVDTSDDQPFFSVDAAAARLRLESFAINYRPLAVPRLLERGLAFLKDAEEARHEIYVITDLTRRSWESNDDSPLASQLSDAEGTALFLIDIGAENPANFSIESIQLDADRFTNSDRLSVEVTAKTITAEAARTIKLEVEKPDPRLPVIQDGQTLVPKETWQQSESVTIPKDGVVTLAMQLGQSLPTGLHHGSVSLVGGDGLAMDDRRYFTIEVAERWKVLVIADKTVNPMNLTALLTPASLVQAGAAPFDVTVTTPADVAQFDLAEFRSVYLLDPAPLEDGLWQRLDRFVFEGGALAVFLGSNAARQAAIDPSFLQPVAKKLLGVEIQEIWNRSDGSVYLSPTDLSHPVFKLLRGQESAVAWFQFPVYFHWGVDLAQNEESSSLVVLRYNDQQPAVVETLYGSGRVMTMTTPITERALTARIKGRPFGAQRDPWNQLFAGVPFPAWALTRQMSLYLVEAQSDTLNLISGQFARLRNDLREFPESYAMFTPDATQAPTRVTAVDGQIVYKFADQPGHYRLKGSRENRPVLRGFSVNLEPGTTDLTRTTAEDLERLLGKGNFLLARDQLEVERQQGTSRKGQEIYPLMLLLLCIVFAMEFLLSNRFYAAVKNSRGPVAA